MSVLGDAEIDLFDGLFGDCGGTISVTRGANPAASVPFIKGRRGSERFSDDFDYASSMRNDFIVKRSDYVSQVGGEPEVDDVIRWTDEAGTARRYQVSVTDSERCFDPVGQFGHLIRIHAVEVVE